MFFYFYWSSHLKKNNCKVIIVLKLIYDQLYKEFYFIRFDGLHNFLQIIILN